MLLFWTSLKDVVRESERESERQYQWPRACNIKRKEKNKTGTSGCGSFVVAYFQPATSIDHLHIH